MSRATLPTSPKKLLHEHFSGAELSLMDRMQRKGDPPKRILAAIGRGRRARQIAAGQLGLEPGPPDCEPAPWAGAAGARTWAAGLQASPVGRSSWGSNLGRRIASQPRGQEGGGNGNFFF